MSVDVYSHLVIKLKGGADASVLIQVVRRLVDEYPMEMESVSAAKEYITSRGGIALDNGYDP